MNCSRAVPDAGKPALTPDLNEAQRFLRALDPDRDRFVFRKIWGIRGTSNTPGNDYVLPLHKLDQLVPLNLKGYGVYFVPNLGYPKNGSLLDAEITEFRCFFVDIDDTKVSEQTIAGLKACPLPPDAIIRTSTVSDTGRGKYQAFWRCCDMPEERWRNLIGRAIEKWPGADRKIKNPARVMRFPGFYHTKNGHQLVEVVWRGPDRPPVTDMELEEHVCAPAELKGALPPGVDPEFRGEDGDLDWPEILGVLNGTRLGNWHDAMVKATASMVARGTPESVILDQIMPHWATPRSKPYTEAEVRKEVKSAIRKAREKWEKQLLAGGLNEDALALAFVKRHGDRLRYCHEHGSWFLWNGFHWEREKKHLAFHWGREIVREHNKANKAALAKTNTAAGVERYCRADPTFAVTSEIWDQDPYLLGTPGGTVNLRTGELRAPRQEDFITKVTAVAPAPPGTVPKRWLRFLEDTTHGDLAMIRFLQQVVGYCLTGDTREHALFFAHGGGGNGKGVFINTITKLLGDYAVVAAMQTFVTSKFDAHPTDLAMLRGARLVTAQETEEGRSWAEARVKQITGGDAISARFMRQDHFTYLPQFKLFFSGNHKPRLHNVGDAERRRFNLLPFTHKPPVPDTALQDKLVSEWPAILRWAIDGCVDWKTNGLQRPGVVTEATESYFDDQDTFGQWLQDNCETGLPLGRFAKAIELYNNYKQYVSDASEMPKSQKAFSAELGKRGFVVERLPGGNRTRIWRRIELKFDQELLGAQP